MQLLINVLRSMWDVKSKIALVKETTTDKFYEEWKTRIDDSTWAPKNCTR